MFDKVFNLIENKPLIVPRLLMCNYKSLGLTEQELVIVIYLMNQENNSYNPKAISDDLKIQLVNVLTTISTLVEKGIISSSMETKNNKKTETISLKPLYDKLTFLIVNEKVEDDNSIFTKIEKEFARSLSTIEYELINGWHDKGYTDELIEEALKEAVYNNVSNLKYMDSILENWKNKGIKTKDAVLKNKKQFKERKHAKQETYDDYDWLNEE